MQSLARLNPSSRSEIVATFSDLEWAALLSDWRTSARTDQVAPYGDWRIWLLLGGRGAGKTRAGAEWVHEQRRRGKRRIALVGPTSADVRDVMVEGESGLLATSLPHEKPRYIPSLRRIQWVDGAVATTYSAEEPERLRGPQHDCAWLDELCAWRRQQDTYDMLMFGLRLGTDPRCVVTTTPRPQPLLKSLIARHGQDVVMTKASTFANAANLAPQFLTAILARYEGTRLGRQEIEAEVIEDAEGALWRRALIEDSRVCSPPGLFRVVVAIDPAVTSVAGSDETGMVVAGIDERRHGYVLEDLSGKFSPDDWARRAIVAYHKHRADRIVAEANNGGDLVESVIRTIDPSVPYSKVYASRGKYARAEPIAALYEQGKVHHVGVFGALEDQMCQWIPGDPSPDRMDALVWALSELCLHSAPSVAPIGVPKPMLVF
jgi:phage terminase large subunit-like protein